MDYYCQRCGRIIGEAERVCPACGVSQDRFKADEEQKACKKCRQEIPVNSNYWRTRLSITIKVNP